MKKGNEWKFGYKAHIGTDSESGLVHSVEVTAFIVADFINNVEERPIKGEKFL